MKANEFDTRFETGKSLLSALDLSKARRVGRQHQQVTIDFPLWIIDSLDREASRLGVTRQSIIKVWVAERLEKVG